MLLASCEKVLDIETDEEPLLVLNGIPTVDRQLFVNFSYSRFFLDTRVSHPVSNAAIAVSVNGMSHTPSDVNGSNYFFSYIPQEDDQIHIEVTADGQRLNADTYVPRLAQIKNLVSMIDTSYSLRFGVTSFDLEDHADYRDYYHFVITSHDSGVRYNHYYDRYDTIDTITSQMFLCFDDLLTGPAAIEPLMGYFYTNLLTHDTFFDGQTRHISLLTLITIDTAEVQPFLHDYTLNVETVTPDRYRYLTDLAANNNMMAAFTEPAPVYSNVRGGYGIFAGNARRTYPLNFDLSGIVLPGKK